MKKKFAIIAAAAALVLAIPASAIAAELSPVAKKAFDESSDIPTSLYVEADVPKGNDGSLVVEVTSEVAQGTILGENEKIAGKFTVYVTGALEESDVQNMLLTVNCGANYAGHAVKIFVYHDSDGAAFMVEGILSATGSFQFNDTRLGEYTVVVGEKVQGGGGGSDVKPTSPVTGYSLTTLLVGAGTVACIAGAFFLARSIRKDNE